MVQSKIAHPSVDERRTRGKEARHSVAPFGSHGVGARRGPARPGGPAGGAEPDPRTGPGAGSPWPDGRVAVHLLPGGGQDHGHRLEGHAHRRPERPVVRRRPPVELRCVRLTRADPAVRPERLRRDPARTVRIRRQTHGRQLHHRGPQQRVHQGRHQRCHPGGGGRLPAGHGRVRGDGEHGDLVRPPVRAGPDESHQIPGQGDAEQKAGRRSEGRREERQEERREGPHPRQPAGPGETL